MKKTKKLSLQTIVLLVAAALLVAAGLLLPTYLDDQGNWEIPGIQTTTPTSELIVGTPWWTDMPTAPGLGRSTSIPTETATVTPTP